MGFLDKLKAVGKTTMMRNDSRYFLGAVFFDDDPKVGAAKYINMHTGPDKLADGKLVIYTGTAELRVFTKDDVQSVSLIGPGVSISMAGSTPNGKSVSVSESCVDYRIEFKDGKKGRIQLRIAREGEFKRLLEI